MEQLIFVGIILLFSVLEAVARKKREGGEVEVPAPPPREPVVRVPQSSGKTIPSYDHDPSFDDEVDGGATKRPVTSESLIPDDVWAEIQALARGGTPTAPPDRAPVQARPRQASAAARAKTPRPDDKAPAPPAKTRSAPIALAPRGGPVRPALAPELPEGSAGHPVHLSHSLYGTPVHDRLTGTGSDGRELRRVSTAAAGVREMLRGDRGSLRRALVLQEILGPPVSLKEDPSAG